MSEIIFENTTNNITFAVDQPQINFQHTQPQISFTAVPGIGSGIEEAPIDGLPYDRLNGGWVEDQKPITESVTKTVAADGDPAGVQDFDSFEEAMVWVENQSTTYSGYIYLALEDGVHYTRDLTVKEYKIRSGYLRIYGASYDKSLVFITVPGSMPDVHCEMFSITAGSYVVVMNATIDPTLSGYSFNDVFVFKCFGPCEIYLYNASVLNSGSAFQIREGSVANVYSCLIDNCNSGFHNWGGFITSRDSTISNSNLYAMATYYNGQIFLDNVNLTGNASDYDITLNEIQPDGSFIIDGTVPLIQADSVGTTSERPDPVMDGFNYFDSTLGIPVWYDGANWVDATGSIV